MRVCSKREVRRGEWLTELGGFRHDRGCSSLILALPIWEHVCVLVGAGVDSVLLEIQFDCWLGSGLLRRHVVCTKAIGGAQRS